MMRTLLAALCLLFLAVPATGAAPAVNSDLPTVSLSIAFIGSDGRILNIDDMAPQTEVSHWSAGPALFALEMRHGWFAERGIRAGDRVEGLIQPRR